MTQSDEYSYTTRTTPSCPVTARLAINTRSWLSYGPGRHLLLFHKILQRSHHQTRKPDHRHIRHSRRTIPSRRARYRTSRRTLCVPSRPSCSTGGRRGCSSRKRALGPSCSYSCTSIRSRHGRICFAAGGEGSDADIVGSFLDLCTRTLAQASTIGLVLKGEAYASSQPPSILHPSLRWRRGRVSRSSGSPLRPLYIGSSNPWHRSWSRQWRGGSRAVRTPAGQVFVLLGLRWLRVGGRLLELRTSCLRAGLADILEVVGGRVTRKSVDELESC